MNPDMTIEELKRLIGCYVRISDPGGSGGAGILARINILPDGAVDAELDYGYSFRVTEQTSVQVVPMPVTETIRHRCETWAVENCPENADTFFESCLQWLCPKHRTHGQPNHDCVLATLDAPNEVRAEKEHVIPGVYQHYKGPKYIVLGIARHANTGMLGVVYHPIEPSHGADPMWNWRPLFGREGWHTPAEVVPETAKGTTTKVVRRFTLLHPIISGGGDR